MIYHRLEGLVLLHWRFETAATNILGLLIFFRIRITSIWHFENNCWVLNLIRFIMLLVHLASGLCVIGGIHRDRRCISPQQERVQPHRDLSTSLSNITIIWRHQMMEKWCLEVGKFKTYVRSIHTLEKIRIIIIFIAMYVSARNYKTWQYFVLSLVVYEELVPSVLLHFQCLTF